MMISTCFNYFFYLAVGPMISTGNEQSVDLSNCWTFLCSDLSKSSMAKYSCNATIEMVLNITGMTPTAHTELSTDSVDNLGLIVNTLLATTVYPTCTAEEVGTLWEHHSNLTVRIFSTTGLVFWRFNFKLLEMFQCPIMILPFHCWIIYFFKALIEVHADILEHHMRWCYLHFF